VRDVVGRVPVAFVATALLLAGCSAGSISGTAPVQGTVTYNGQPVAGATVSFVGEGDARMAVATTDAGGSYQLMTLDTAGAMPGKYTVLVTKTETVPDSDKVISMDEAAKNTGKAKEPKNLLPARFGDPAKTPLTFEVKPGQTNKFDLKLAD